MGVLDFGRRALLAAAAAVMPPAPASLRPPLTLAYGAEADQCGDLYLPEAQDGPLSVVALLHGGFWQAGYTRELMRPLALDLCGSGVAVWKKPDQEAGGSDPADVCERV